MRAMNESGSQHLPEIVLSPPEPVAAVAPQQLEKGGPVPLADEERQRLDERVGGFVSDLLSAPLESEAFKERIDAIVRMGEHEIEASANVSTRLLARPVNASGTSGQQAISKGLLDLRNTCERLDPKKQDLLAPSRVLGILPFGNRIKRYFQGYQSAQTHLNGIIESLLSGKDELLRDNAAIEQERAQMWTLMGKLEASLYLCKKIDAEISAQIAAVEVSDSARAKELKESALFSARQRVTDLLTQMAVNVQGYMALDLIKKNNLELIKGVDRARTTTLAALRTAVIVASALGNQRLVLDQIGALKETTGTMIAATSEMLQAQSTQIFQGASDPTVDVAKLEAAFEMIYATIDAIDVYKVQALGAMSQTVAALDTQVGKAKSLLAPRRDG
jgi:uncharacterized protein YaaN involved in tellurite resistance